MRFIARNEHLYALLRFAGTQERFASLVEEAQEIQAQDTARHISDAIIQGMLPPGDPKMMGHAVVATVFHFARLRASGLVELPVEELSRFVAAYCIRGLGGDPSAVLGKDPVIGLSAAPSEERQGRLARESG